MTHARDMPDSPHEVTRAEESPRLAAPHPATSPSTTALQLQRSAGNAATGRILRAGKRPLEIAILQRQSGGGPSPWWSTASGVQNELDRRDTLIRDTLPYVTIASDADLQGFLQRWLDASAQIDASVASLLANNPQTLARCQQQYVDATKLILMRAELGLSRTAASIVTQNSALVRASASAEISQFAQLDRFERLDPSRPGHAVALVLRTINPSAPVFTSRPCTQNCPAAAAATQSYLRTGAFPTSRCSPLSEPRNGYAITPDPTTWSRSQSWAAAWPAIQRATAQHGQCVVVEADRGAGHPANLTQWHYFVVLNVRGTQIVVDGFLGQVAANVGNYVTSLQASMYVFTATQMQAVAQP
jgi:hypothetical protein